MKKIVFLVHKTSEETFNECVNSINVLKKPPAFLVKCIGWSEDNKHNASDIYNNFYKEYQPDYTVLVEDTVLFVDEYIIYKFIKIFSSDSNIGLIGIKGAEKLPESCLIEEADIIYGSLYVMNEQREVFEKLYSNPDLDYVEVEAVSGTMLVMRGNIPTWADLSYRVLGEIMSISTVLQGLKVVVPYTEHPWCFSTAAEPVLSSDEIDLVKRKKKVKEILFNTNHCLLTFGIPTYNRSKYFRKCISNIYYQIENLPWVEVFVSNNDSTDDTEDIALQYTKYKNFRYYKQPVNIKDKNFNYLYQYGRGDFVVACGDDDYYSNGVILSILEAICLYPESAVIGLAWPFGNMKSALITGKGLDNFLVETTHIFTCISCVILNHKYYMEIDVKDRFSYTHLNQVYVEMEMVRKHPNYAIVCGNNFCSSSGEAATGRIFAKKTPFCDIFIREYYPILDYFLDKGLSKDAYEKEKLKNLNKIIAWLYAIKNTGDYIQWMIDEDLKEIMDEYYGYEPYYDEMMVHINKILHK